MNKKIFERVLALVLVFVMCISTTVMAATPIRVMINGSFITTDTDPDIINGRTMIPLRAALEALGTTVEWSAATRSATATNDRFTLKIALNSTDVQIVNNKTNKTENYTMDVAPAVVNNRMLVPVRFMATMLGKAVVWDSTERIAKIIDSTYVYDYFKNNATNLYDLISVARTGLEFNQSTGEFTTSMPISLTDQEKVTGEVKVSYEFKNKDGAVSANVKLGLSTEIETQLKEVLESTSDFSEITFDLYCDKDRLFIDSSLLQDQSVGQIIKLLTGITSDTSKGIYITSEGLNQLFGKDVVGEITSVTSLDEMLDVMISSRVTDTIELANFEEAIKFVGYLLSNDNLTKTTDGYSLNVDLAKYNEAASKIEQTSYMTLLRESLKDLNITANVVTTNGKINKIDATFNSATDTTQSSEAATMGGVSDGSVSGKISVQNNASLTINVPDFANMQEVVISK